MSPIEKFIIDNRDYLEELNKTLNFNQIFEKTGLPCSSATFGQYLRKYLDYTKYKEVKRKFNAFYFDNIDTAEKAYLLGFIVADGCLYPPQNVLIIAIAEQDIEINLRFQKALEGGKLNLQFKENPLHQNISRLTYTSKHLLESLNNLGIPSNKSKCSFGIPNIPEDLIIYFINGYFDGDGCISCWGRNVWEICFTDSNDVLLLEIKSYIENLLGIKGYFRKRNNYFTLKFAGLKNAKIFYEGIYSKGKTLKRKQDKFLDAISC